jgi:gluconolactonase
MQRRKFMSLTAGAATALEFEPWALAEEQERKSLVVYPDPAVEVIDPRFEKYRVGNAVVERLYTSPIQRHPQQPNACDGWKRLEFSPKADYIRFARDTGRIHVAVPAKCKPSPREEPHWTRHLPTP